LLVAAIAGATAPGGNGRIAFRTYLDPQQSWGAVFTVDPDGSAVRQITHPPRGTVDDQPSWSPDGKRIAFTRCASGALCHVYVVAPDGSGLAPVGPVCPKGANEQSCSDDANASFSPDSKHIALTQSTGQVKSDPRTEDWIEHSTLVVTNTDGSGRRVVYQGRAFSGDLNFPVFSPDGKRLVFERDTSRAFQHRPGDGRST
jgi:Tol biopolymer transport system component